MPIAANDLTVILAYSGVVTVVGSVIAALLRSHSGRGEARAHAANLLAEGYGSFADDLQQDNNRLRKQESKMRAAMLALTDAVDILVNGTVPSTSELLAAREANKAAKELL